MKYIVPGLYISVLDGTRMEAYTEYRDAQRRLGYKGTNLD